MTHPGVGPVTALAFVLIIGYPESFQCGKQIGSYIGLIPQEVYPVKMWPYLRVPNIGLTNRTRALLPIVTSS